MHPRDSDPKVDARFSTHFVFVLSHFSSHVEENSVKSIFPVIFMQKDFLEVLASNTSGG